MTQSKKFIITQDKAVSDILIAHGFCLLSNTCGMYTFINNTTGNFNFSSIDSTKVHFTNKINI